MRYDYCPYKKHAQREDNLKTKAEDGHLRCQGERPEEKPAPLTQALRLLASRGMRKYISLFKPPSLWWVCYGSPRQTNTPVSPFQCIPNTVPEGSFLHLELTLSHPCLILFSGSPFPNISSQLLAIYYGQYPVYMLCIMNPSNIPDR